MKKALRVISAVLVLMLLSCTVALAEPKNKTQKANEKAVKTAVKEANKEIKKAVKAAQKSEEDDVDELLAKVDEIANATFEYADSLGVEVECSYTYYEVDGQNVAIDPLKVINLKRK